MSASVSAGAYLPAAGHTTHGPRDLIRSAGQRTQQMAEPLRRARLPPGRGLHREVTGLQDRAASFGRGGEQGVILGGAQRREPAGCQVGGGPDTEVRAVYVRVRPGAERVLLLERVR